jgi:hypothetical protein
LLSPPLVRKPAIWIAAALSLGTGCAPSIQEASKLATSGATEAMSSPANQQRFESIVESPEMQKAIGDLSAVAMSRAATAVKSALQEATNARERSAHAGGRWCLGA